MDIISSLFIVPFYSLWIFLIMWLFKPKYFPLFKQRVIPSRLTVLGITAVIYIALSIVLILTIDTSAIYDEASVSDFDLIVALFSILLLIMLVFWSRSVASKRKNEHNTPLYKVSNYPIAGSPIANHQKHQLIVKVAELIANLHKQGQYHGDINPNTILLEDINASDIDTKSTDFDSLITNLTLTKPVHSSVSKLKKSSKNTLVAIENPAYQAPERWQGEKATAQSDIYAFGIMLYEILTDKLPFNIAEQSFDPMLDWNNQHCLTPIPKLAEDYRPYQFIIDKSLAKQKKKSYQDMQAVLLDLQLLN